MEFKVGKYYEYILRPGEIWVVTDIHEHDIGLAFVTTGRGSRKDAKVDDPGNITKNDHNSRHWKLYRENPCVCGDEWQSSHFDCILKLYP